MVTLCCYGNATNPPAIYEYEGSEDHCIPLDLGEGVFIYEECDSWYRGCATRNQNITVSCVCWGWNGGGITGYRTLGRSGR